MQSNVRKAKKNGQDTRKEEIEIEEGVRDDKTAERKARLEKSVNETRRSS